ncbi:hypothetical protein BCV70DRAFT_38126 [Testicularia cyperi]|uniref:Uncharacterized protein n=1 Tax=Testicularia cyperi TaxID=1882483 RepID=A0A317XJU5_9BASI|nr:hypothetical protein BCV70DRAFT_38126 [Testicularia cyperi]
MGAPSPPIHTIALCIFGHVDRCSSLVTLLLLIERGGLASALSLPCLSPFSLIFLHLVPSALPFHCLELSPLVSCCRPVSIIQL